MFIPRFQRLTTAILLVLLCCILPAPAGGAAGTLIPSWTRQFGTTTDDRAYDVGIDTAGNIYVLGATFGAFPNQTNQGSYDVFLRKYDPTGTEVWTRQFGTPETDAINGVAVDSHGNTVVVGYTAGSFSGQPSSDYHVFVRSYDSAGTERWTHQFDTPERERGAGVAVDPKGNSYVVGSVWGAFPGQTNSGLNDAFLRKYDTNGVEVWTRQFGTTSGDEATGVALASQGTIYVVGYTSGTFLGQTSSGNNDAFIRAYDPAGTEVWTRQFGTTSDDEPRNVTVDSQGTTYIVGSTSGAFPGQAGGDIFVRAYDSTGTDRWTRQFRSTAYDAALDVAVDSQGTIYVVGSTNGTLPGQTNRGSADAFIQTYDRTGTPLWTRQFGTEQYDAAFGVVVDSQDHGYVTGFTAGTLPGQINYGSGDAFLIKLEELRVTATVALPLATRQSPPGW